MPPTEHFAYDDELLTRYLLGNVSADQAEKLDELSVADDEFAWRLTGVENDLVDGFVRGEMRGENLNRFRSFYLSSAKRQQKVEFAAGFLSLKERAAGEFREQSPRATNRSWWRWISPFRQWSFAAAALALLFVAGYLFTDNLSLRRQGDVADLNRQHEQQLQQELDQQRASNAQLQHELDNSRGTTTVLGQLNTIALLLPAPTRSAVTIENVSIHPGTDLLVLALSLESDDFPQYRISLKDPATRQEIWHSTTLLSSTSAGHKTVTGGVPAKLLRQQRYLAQLIGIQRNGKVVPVADYPFSAVLR